MDLEEMVVYAIILRNRKKSKRRKYWVHPLWSNRLISGKFYTMFANLRTYPDQFFRYFRMSATSFDELLILLKPAITYENTRLRLSIPPEERLAVTLRYLASGSSFYSISFEYLLGPTTIREIVKSTCIEIWNIMQPIYMAEKSEEDWINIANQFFRRTNFPNVVGAIDGKHIRIIQPDNSGSQFFNYKKFFSIILMAWVDADYKFVYVDIGVNGAASDSSVFQKSHMGERLQRNQLNIPEDRPLPNDENGKNMPFCVVGDEAFGLSRNVLRPYAKKSLNTIKKIYNYRHSRARRMVECTFGILSNKWRILHRPLDVHIDFCDVIVKACCILHNYVRCKDGITFKDTAYECPLESVSTNPIERTLLAANIRNYFSSYFISSQGAVPWQYDKI